MFGTTLAGVGDAVAPVTLAWLRARAWPAEELRAAAMTGSSCAPIINGIIGGGMPMAAAAAKAAGFIAGFIPGIIPARPMLISN